MPRHDNSPSDSTPAGDRQQYQHLYAFIPGMVYRRRPDWSVQVICHSEHLCGYPPDEFESGRINWLDLIHPDDRSKVYQQAEHLTRRAGQLVQVYRIKTRDGDIRWVEDHKRSSFDEDGTLLGVDGVVFDITERIRMETALSQREQQFRAFMDSAPCGFAIFDAEMNLTAINKAGLAMLPKRTRPEDVLGRSLREFLTPHDDSTRLEQYLEVIRTGKPLFLEDVPAGPEYRNVRLSVQAFKVAGGLGLIATDITAHKQAEQELRASEAKYRFLFDAVPTGIGISDFDGNVVDVNRVTEQMLGYTLPELKTMNARDYYADPSLRDRLVAVLKKEGRLRDQEITFRRKDGSLLHALMNADVIEHQGRQVLLATTRDITRRVKAEKALRQSEQRYRTVVESAGETIAIISTDGVFLFMNGTGAERLGGRPEDYIGKTMWDLFPKEIADRQVDSVRTVVETGKGINVVVPTVLQGRTRWYNTTVEPLRDSDGRISSALIVARDVHEIRLAQMELEAMKENMARAESLASLGTLSATLAHELTQPMTVIALSVEDALAELDATGCPESARQSLEDCLRELANVTSIVERFRNFARRSSDRQLARVNLETVAGRIVQLLYKAAEQARVKLSVQDLDRLPRLYSNEKDIEQLFFAMAQNAIQAADGKKPSKLTIKGRQLGRRIELRFVDTCGGIEQACLDRIFEPFFTTKPPGMGTGLGLCIVRRIAEQNGGKVAVKNRPGKGATFIVTLPIDRAQIP